MAYRDVAANYAALVPTIKAALAKACVNIISSANANPQADQSPARWCVNALRDLDSHANLVAFIVASYYGAKADVAGDNDLDGWIGGLIPVLARMA